MTQTSLEWLDLIRPVVKNHNEATRTFNLKEYPLLKWMALLGEGAVTYEAISPGTTYRLTREGPHGPWVAWWFPDKKCVIRKGRILSDANGVSAFDDLVGPCTLLPALARFILDGGWQPLSRVEQFNHLRKGETGTTVGLKSIAYDYIPEWARPFMRRQKSDSLDDIVLWIKLFSIGNGWTWYLSEYGKSSDIAYGYVEGFEKEWGDIYLPELRECRWRSIPAVERDLHWDARTYGQLIKERESKTTITRPVIVVDITGISEATEPEPEPEPIEVEEPKVAVEMVKDDGRLDYHRFEGVEEGIDAELWKNLNGNCEVKFSKQPSDTVRKRMCAMKMRYNGRTESWYGKARLAGGWDRFGYVRSYLNSLVTGHWEDIPKDEPDEEPDPEPEVVECPAYQIIEPLTGQVIGENKPKESELKPPPPVDVYYVTTCPLCLYYDKGANSQNLINQCMRAAANGKDRIKMHGAWQALYLGYCKRNKATLRKLGPGKCPHPR